MVTTFLPCQYVPLHQWDLGKALELTMSQGNSLAGAFLCLCAEVGTGKKERKKKPVTVSVHLPDHLGYHHRLNRGAVVSQAVLQTCK